MSGRGRRERTPSDPIIKVRGLPYEATAIDLCKFFSDCRLKGGPRGIYFCTNDRKLPTGTAYVELESFKDVKTALRRNRDTLGNRYVEIYETNQDELDDEIRNGATNEFGFNENRRDRGRLDMDSGRSFRGSGGGGGRGFGRGGGSGGGGGRFRDDSPPRGARQKSRSRSRERRSYAPPRNCASEHCIKLRGLPWSATKEDVVDWLDDVDCCGGSDGVVFIMDQKINRPSGDAYVEVETSADIKRALRLHKKNMGSRYVEVFEANSKDVARAKDIEDNDKEREEAYMVNLRGLPYRTTEREIIDWVSEAAEPFDVVITMDKMGRPSGQANAYFKTEDEALKVVKEMHRRDLGTRYIECYLDGVRESNDGGGGGRDRDMDRSRSPIRGRRSSRRDSDSD